MGTSELSGKLDEMLGVTCDGLAIFHVASCYGNQDKLQWLVSKLAYEIKTNICAIFLFNLVDMEVDTESDTHPSGMVNGHAEKEATKTDSDQKSKSKLRLSFEDYRSMARSIAGYLRAEEDRAGEGKLYN